jgi:hypothetical protein
MMKDDQGGNQDDTLIGSVVKKSKHRATESLVESLSSAANSAVDLATKAANEITVAVCRENLDRLAATKSIVNTSDVRDTGKSSVCMSPLIEAMLWACALTIGDPDQRGEGGAWVVCAPTNQGKTFATEFLIHGDHTLRPKRSLKIDATNMKDFPKECASFLNCPAAADSLALLLCQALAGTATNADAATTFAAKASLHAGKMMCEPEGMIPFDTSIKMRDAEEYDDLKLGQDLVPCPILIIDEFYRETEENSNFIRTLYKEASNAGVIVFVITTDREWATKLIKLNGGEKIKPLAKNVDNEGYNGVKRFLEVPQWNNLSWTLSQLRFLVGPFCLECGLDPTVVVPAGSNFSPSEALKNAKFLRAHKEADRRRGKKKL